MIDLFPFNLVERGSTILLYGLGKCGCAYFEQNEQLKWCSIKYVSDKTKPAKDFKDIYVKPDDISKVINQVDWVVIGISHPAIVKQIKDQMVKNGIDEDIIISAIHEDSAIINDFEDKNIVKREKRKVLLTMEGGLGDFVVYLSFYQRLLEYLPAAEIIIQGRTAFLDAIYGQKANVTIVSRDYEIENLNEFDCILVYCRIDN